MLKKIFIKAMRSIGVNIFFLEGHYKITIRDAVSGNIKRVYNYSNIVPTVGRTMIANNLTDTSPDNAPRINYVALGAGVNVPANSDTQLQTENYRNAVASQTNSTNIAYVTGFFTSTECNGTYKEAGLFSNGTGAANSGVLVSRVAIDVTKSNTETLTIDWTLTIS